ncbi:hypothetical protein OROGR_025473 [Orobanche gracilis]
MDENKQKLAAAKLRWEASRLAEEARTEILRGIYCQHEATHYGGSSGNFGYLKGMKEIESERTAEAPAFLTRAALEIYENENKYLNFKDVVSGIYPDLESADSARKRKMSEDRAREAL